MVLILHTKHFCRRYSKCFKLQNVPILPFPILFYDDKMSHFYSCSLTHVYVRYILKWKIKCFLFEMLWCLNTTGIHFMYIKKFYLSLIDDIKYIVLYNYVRVVRLFCCYLTWLYVYDHVWSTYYNFLCVLILRWYCKVKLIYFLLQFCFCIQSMLTCISVIQQIQHANVL